MKHIILYTAQGEIDLSEASLIEWVPPGTDMPFPKRNSEISAEDIINQLPGVFRIHIGHQVYIVPVETIIGAKYRTDDDPF